MGCCKAQDCRSSSDEEHAPRRFLVVGFLLPWLQHKFATSRYRVYELLISISITTIHVLQAEKFGGRGGRGGSGGKVEGGAGDTKGTYL